MEEPDSIKYKYNLPLKQNLMKLGSNNIGKYKNYRVISSSSKK